ncbi:hypothetical protein A2631_00120 [Candidatus Daviesbacteria bacterium RIFCSPHIGHO2_01_FULL_44_29]|uniref:Glycosyl transferase family 1 domain-containing protein n=1 Tax=Candidatus Daviesbacteria bacterium RIFCSPHIGHO2_02_FULL_43_12 TaxID=1797776 RepID=A0A1F5KI94_9BACT|nr:MAG: hypothetical protein A2631_00120 [Candidatus Daviesbacteria bacterium RIFCSPHIGHO2_01_FULL_44_29]OGE40559.1 MAG: hypothetical protein A3D25_00375 [Candidatus Daviesbacteria bacterium RIFCSPHIGHO2_02_FULL_43_12]OGE40923.1 MAG: hypothetical protein A3E86_05545 [Candidatus Daviesbacteria bacterium RIFCSPHIGHO2_12_FULL_47_45]OGE70119.1 MAG: hypothetical protein A3B55_00145 [Candidatus Daviesbacteria bacterium RIFCSPLOWO2_01_FULL_43_15]
MRVALVHDYLREYGGAERVLETLHEMFPDAPVYTAYFNPQGLGSHAAEISKWDIRSSALQKVPFARKLVSPFRLFAPMIFEGFDLREYDLVISSCAIYFAKAVITSPSTLHLSYIHTPPRYLYGYTTSFNYKKNPLTRVLGELANHILRVFDYETSQRPDVLIANSENVAARIRKFYRREPVIIYPPVDVSEISRQSSVVRKSESSRLKADSYYLSLSRLVRGKGVDVVIKACNQAKVNLKVAGTGPEAKYLKSISGPTIEFVGEVTDEERVKLYAGAKALILASEDEDFGITAVEAQAAGTPVIAPRSGGYLETIIEGKTGVFYEVAIDKSQESSLVQTLQSFDPAKFKAEDCQKQAEKFSKERFKEKMLELIKSNLKSQIF